MSDPTTPPAGMTAEDVRQLDGFIADNRSYARGELTRGAALRIRATYAAVEVLKQENTRMFERAKSYDSDWMELRAENDALRASLTAERNARTLNEASLSGALLAAQEDGKRFNWLATQRWWAPKEWGAPTGMTNLRDAVDAARSRTGGKDHD